MASFDPSERASAAWQLKAKFGGDYEEMEAIAVAFINTELRDPFEVYRNDPRVAKTDAAIATLLERLRALPEEMQTADAHEVKLPFHELVHHLERWRLQLKVFENEPNPNSIGSVLAAQSIRVRFAYELGGPWHDANKPGGRVSGRDLALFAIALGIEKYGPNDDCDRIVDAWKKAQKRAFEIFLEFQGEKPRRRRRAKRGY